MFQLYVILCIANAIITIVFFFLYVQARMAHRSEDPRRTPEQQAKYLADLDRKESRYQSIHFITLSLFVLFGVLILVQLSDRFNPKHIY